MARPNRRYLLAAIAGLIALLFAYTKSRGAANPPPPPAAVQGRNNTVLFLVDKHPGLTNVHYATASVLLEQHPEVAVHFATFSEKEKEADTVSRFARRRNPQARPIVFHGLSGRGFMETMDRPMPEYVHGRDARGMRYMFDMLPHVLQPWRVEEHLALVGRMEEVIEEVDPAVVVLDCFFMVGIDAARKQNRLMSVVAPNQAVDSFVDRQPWGQMFWKYPALATGFKFPVPWKDIPMNIYLRLRLIYSVLHAVFTSKKTAVYKAHGIQEPVGIFNIYRPDVPFMSASLAGASLPLAVVPPNVTLVGPIVRASAPAEEQDPELAGWLARGPTVLVALGSAVLTDLQVLWKFKKYDEYDDAFLEPLRAFLDSGRLRMPKWIDADPYSMLETGHIVLSVHHGGANSFGEALAAGVPQALLPMWLDCYNYAAMVEDFGIGVWAGKESSPEWKAEELGEAFLRALDGDNPASIAMREKAQEIGRIARSNPGREQAARIIARLAASGK
ncbi:hypothetical protein GE09DRAFT_1024633 [Coniochaeta sp. 2T2.1]|nr:hypothetical protein GE09DRAFT_1024633 [Coniochaeta sp. 2T2.1]